MLAAAIQQWWIFVVQGVLGIIFGILVILFPAAAIFTFVFLFAVWAIASGIGAISQGMRLADRRRPAWPYFALGVVSIAVGVLAVLMPGPTVLSLILLLGAWQLVTGLTEIYVAWKIRREIETEWLLALAGLLRAILGLVFLLVPAIGLVASLILIAANAFAFGILAILIGLRLRSLRDRPSTAAGRRGAPA